MTSFFVELIERTDESRRAFETHRAIVEAVAEGMPVERYRTLLCELYHIVWHFNPICAAAASRMDDTLAEVRYYLYRHMQEEAGHENWVLDDLGAVGFERDRVLRYAPSADVLALTGFNYWSSERRHPASILGMLYVLEVIASVYGGPFASAITERLLLQHDRGISFLRSHASLDTVHMADLRKVLNLVKAPDAQNAIVESIVVNFHLIKNVFTAI